MDSEEKSGREGVRVYGDLRACVVRVIDGSSSGSSNSRNIKTVIMMIMTKYRITCESAREREEEREREKRSLIPCCRRESAAAAADEHSNASS